MPYVKRPNGFRAVRMRGKTEVVYCVEMPKRGYGSIERGAIVIDTYTADGSKQAMSANTFNATHAREYSPMPDAVRAMFDGKPSFAEWWDARQSQK